MNLLSDDANICQHRILANIGIPPIDKEVI